MIPFSLLAGILWVDVAMKGSHFTGNILYTHRNAIKYIKEWMQHH